MIKENKELCARCGGQCCKNGGCDFSVNDLTQVTAEELQKHIDSGLISIAADISIDNNGQLKYFLFVRMRNVGKEAIDLTPTTPAPCAALTPNGCPYSFENRPSGGRDLIPVGFGECYYEEYAYLSWISYQGLLKDLIIKNTGLTFEEKLRNDLEEVFYQFFQLSRFDQRIRFYTKYLNLTSIGMECNLFDQELKNAWERCQQAQKLNRLNPIAKLF